MKNELLQLKENEVVTTSLMVAEKFNKKHWTIVRDIDNLISSLEGINKNVDTPLFTKGTHINEQNGQAYPMYYINRDGFALLVMGFNNTRVVLEWKLKYIEAFNEMEKRLKNPALTDNRLEIARLILSAPESKLSAILELYPEYFSHHNKGSLEYISDVNTSYTKWIEDYGITADWISHFPTLDVFNNYVRYCVERNLLNMGKKHFYKTLETDFNFTRRQGSNGYRYFIRG